MPCIELFSPSSSRALFCKRCPGFSWLVLEHWNDGYDRTVHACRSFKNNLVVQCTFRWSKFTRLVSFHFQIRQLSKRKWHEHDEWFHTSHCELSFSFLKHQGYPNAAHQTCSFNLLKAIYPRYLWFIFVRGIRKTFLKEIIKVGS